eukprot:2091950-Rhodomonas_salina.1
MAPERGEGTEEGVGGSRREGGREGGKQGGRGADLVVDHLFEHHAHLRQQLLPHRPCAMHPPYMSAFGALCVRLVCQAYASAIYVRLICLICQAYVSALYVTDCQLPPPMRVRRVCACKHSLVFLYSCVPAAQIPAARWDDAEIESVFIPSRTLRFALPYGGHLRTAACAA